MHFRTIYSVLGAVTLAVAAGCASPGYVSTIRYPNVSEFPQTDPSSVEILRAEPTREHLKLGEITVDISYGSPPLAQELDARVRAEAAKLGADAVVLVLDMRIPPGAVASKSWWGAPRRPVGREVIGVAIKYR